MQYNTNVKYATLCGRRPYTSTIMLAFYRHMCDRVLIAWRGVRYGVLLNNNNLPIGFNLCEDANPARISFERACYANLITY